MTHTALLNLPDILENLGLNVVVSDGWEQGQQSGGVDYLWTQPDDDGDRSHDYPPSCYMVHHTAGDDATIPPVATSKANAWIGLLREDGRLYQYGDGTPTIALVTAGPATISAGSGFRPAAWDYTFQNLRAPWDALGPDTDPEVYLNRLAFSAETVCEGLGTDLDVSVWEHVVGLGVGLHMLSEQWGDFTGTWQERTLGHLSWTVRKTDPEWSVGLPNDGTKCVIDIQNQIATNLTEGEPMYIPILPGTTREGDVRWMQRALNRTGADLAADGVYGDVTEAAVTAFQKDQALPQNGNLTAKTYDYLLAAAYDKSTTTVRWIYPKQSEPPTTRDAEFVLESFQILAVKADTGSTYDGVTSTTSFLQENGITVGVWDDAFVALVGKLCPWSDGAAIGPREEARLVASQPGIKGDKGEPGATGVKGDKGDPGAVTAGTKIMLGTEATVTEIL